jgi:hypothetical protein
VLPGQGHPTSQEVVTDEYGGILIIRGKPKKLRVKTKNYPCHFAHHKSQQNHLELDPRLYSEEPAPKHELWHSLWY